MPRKSAASRGRKRWNEAGMESPPPANVAKMVAESEWRSSSIRGKDLLRLIAEQVLEEEGVAQWRTAGSNSSPWEMTQWFYIGNHQPNLPGWDNFPPWRQECWLEKLTEEKCRDIPELIKQIKALKDKGVTRESVAYSFIEQRIQPLQQRVHLEYKTVVCQLKDADKQLRADMERIRLMARDKERQQKELDKLCSVPAIRVC
ncbi:hypothetical protein C2845_PM03G30770 [Panicum miliaceum]|uniref:Uncharacterized protein n=1 Tax=Panicum miliaceum TaxID=4540 RepID=A0A3L6T9L5_PANMI|nr:hypothetical protein C2845_PM03G30770 [Panicum miliaceum]